MHTYRLPVHFPTNWLARVAFHWQDWCADDDFDAVDDDVDDDGMPGIVNILLLMTVFPRLQEMKNYQHGATFHKEMYCGL